MSARRGKRVLSRDERWLWTKVTGAYEPLKGRPLFLKAESQIDELPPAIEEAKLAQVKKQLPALETFRPERKPPEHTARGRGTVPKHGESRKLPPIAPLERKALRSIRRGVKAVDGVLDLHGMYQTEAHYALLSFLRQSQSRGASLVLVITGKGDADSGFYRGPDERGVLKRIVPQWLNMPEIRPFVVSFGEASQHHGGTGALYVRLRRYR